MVSRTQIGGDSKIQSLLKGQEIVESHGCPYAQGIQHLEEEATQDGMRVHKRAILYFFLFFLLMCFSKYHIQLIPFLSFDILLIFNTKVVAIYTCRIFRKKLKYLLIDLNEILIF